MVAHLLRAYAHRVPDSLTRHLINLYPPFLGAGIRIDELSEDRRFIRVRLIRSWFNANYVGTQFGGSIYAMTDPFYMLMLMHNLGPQYIVWDKAASIEFIKPGKADLLAEFCLDDRLIETVKRETRNGEKFVFDLPVDIHDGTGLCVAKVWKTLYVRRKNPKNKDANGQNMKDSSSRRRS